MAAKRNKVIKTLKKLVNDIEKDIPINRAYMFGSYARGKPGKWSDIDLALVSSRFRGIRFYDFKMLLPKLKGYSDFIEVHPFKTKDFQTKNLFIKEIIKNGIRIK